MDEFEFEAAIAPLGEGETNYYVSGAGSYGGSVSDDGTIVNPEDESFAPATEQPSGILSIENPNGYGMSTTQSIVDNSLLSKLLNGDGQDLATQAKTAIDASNKGDPEATDWLKSLSKTLGGDKAVAALIQGGFGMLAGASQGKMLEEKMKNDKQRRDEEWARKDAHSYAGKVAPMKFGLLGSK